MPSPKLTERDVLNEFGKYRKTGGEKPRPETLDRISGRDDTSVCSEGGCHAQGRGPGRVALASEGRAQPPTRTVAISALITLTCPAASVSQASRVSPAGWDFSVLLDAGVELLAVDRSFHLDLLGSALLKRVEEHLRLSLAFAAWTRGFRTLSVPSLSRAEHSCLFCLEPASGSPIRPRKLSRSRHVSTAFGAGQAALSPWQICCSTHLSLVKVGARGPHVLVLKSSANTRRCDFQRDLFCSRSSRQEAILQ